MDVFERAGVFADSDGDAAHADGATIKFADDGFEDASVHFIETAFIDVTHGERGVGHFAGDDVLRLHERIVAHPAEEVICDARRAT